MAKRPSRSPLYGSFELRSAWDLLRKLESDVEQLKRDPGNTYLAFNAFVTAEHINEWVYPGDANKGTRRDLVLKFALLEVCSHVANGAKHFQVQVKGLDLLANGDLILELDRVTAQKLGHTSITALELAKRVLRFWKRRIP
jgi:hypothetical protein